MNNLRKDIFMLNKNSIQPLYKQLMDIITQQTKTVLISPEKKPSEPELADLYHVSGHCPTYRGGALHTGLSYQASGKRNLCKIPHDLPEI